jgi:predicted GNAT family acetyltransferase
MAPKIINNTLKHRFETEVGAQTAFLVYQVAADQITFTHTRVPPALEGRGIGTALVKAAMDHAREHSLRVVIQCPFVAEVVQSHPQYQSLLAS